MNKKLTLSVSIVLLTALMGCSALNAVFPTATVPAPTAAPLPTLPSSTAPDLTVAQGTLTNIYQTYSPGVVTIQTSTGLGSGWVYNSDGVIVTNAHVVGTETQVEVDFPSGLKTFGTVIGVDTYSDLAVIKVTVDASQLHPLPMGDSNALSVGQSVIAIGNPFGLSGTMTTGIISALGRALPGSVTDPSGASYTSADIIQTDAAINPGNSGGPLMNLNGQVVGINSSIESSSTGTGGQPVNSGIGFAISINLVKKVVPDLITNGKYAYPYLGVSTIDGLSLQEIQALGLKSTSGAYVTSVVPGGPAATAGILAGATPLSIAGTSTGVNSGGDLITAIDGQPVVTFSDLIRYLILNKNPGDTITLTVLRGDQTLQIPVVLGTRP
ncbi:MAG: trypsin-like peptidase domain-containing protein [Anaerolineales bacterium]